jgi:hypothetical protein
VNATFTTIVCLYLCICTSHDITPQCLKCSALPNNILKISPGGGGSGGSQHSPRVSDIYLVQVLLQLTYLLIHVC